MATAIKLVNITKKFPGVVANDSINLEVEKGEVHAICGENGAGKSTLMSMIYGLQQPTSGEIYINGKQAIMSSSRDAIALGIGMVHQHFMLIQKLTVAENIVLGAEPGSALRLDRKKAVEEVKKLSKQYGLDVDSTAKISDLSVGAQQRVEILKAIYRGADILILDEPTAVLTPQEIQDLFVIIRTLTAQGKTIILITHKLDEVIEISNRVSVIRLGKNVGMVNTKETDPSELTRMMVGREVHLGGGERLEHPSDEVVLALTNASIVRKDITLLNNVTLQVKRGEILGIAGVDGNGQQQLVEAISGLQRLTSGKLKLCGNDISESSIRQIRDSGLGYIPEDRHKDGLVLDFSIAENMILGLHQHAPFKKKPFWMNYSAIFKNAEDKVSEFDIRTPNVHVNARTLSGGNQQKIIIARELIRQPELVVATQPTRGLDVGAIEFVHRTLVDARNNGKAVLLVSLELDELLALSDRIAIMYQGELMGIVNIADATREELGLYMLGLKRDKIESTV